MQNPKASYADNMQIVPRLAGKGFWDTKANFKQPWGLLSDPEKRHELLSKRLPFAEGLEVP